MLNRRREERVASEPRINRSGNGSPLSDRPHDETLPPAHVAGDEDTLNICGPRAITSDIATAIEFDSKLIKKSSLFRTNKAHGKENKIAGEFKLGAFNRHEARTTIDDLGDNLYCSQATKVPVVIAQELECVDRIDAFAALFMG